MLKNKVRALCDVPPAPFPAETPMSYADRLGRWYGERIDDGHRKAHGHYLTPPAIAGFMGSLCARVQGGVVRLLDPAAGAGILAAAACQALAGSRRIELVAYEVDTGLALVLEACFQHLRAWLAERGTELVTRIEFQDFVLANAGILEGGLFPHEHAFDAVICNPPYFKLPKSDLRAQACLTVVHGQPNVYGLFMALGAALLREGGRFVFITPRSFASGPYFQKFRQWFFERIRLTDLHVFESRTEAFDEVLQETVITAGLRGDGRAGRDGTVRLTVSAGAHDLERSAVRTLPFGDVLSADSAHRVLYLPASEEHDQARAIVSRWPGSLHAYGLEVSTGPVVAFRAKALLRDVAGEGAAPLLWLQHVRPMEAVWPMRLRKAQFIEDGESAAPVLLPNRNYVLIRRFSAKEEKRRLTAAPFLAESFPHERVGFENHLNYIRRPGGELSGEEAFGLAALLNSRLLDTWFRIGSGNTQVSATELRAMPLPPLETIRRIGERIVREGADWQTVTAEVLGYGS